MHAKASQDALSEISLHPQKRRSWAFISRGAPHLSRRASRISDAGPGLPSELRAHPFQRFAQVPGKRRREGSGLGLSIVKALTLSQGGSVEADDSERGGARFTLRFPRI